MPHKITIYQYMEILQSELCTLVLLIFLVLLCVTEIEYIETAPAKIEKYMLKLLITKINKKYERKLHGTLF